MMLYKFLSSIIHFCQKLLYRFCGEEVGMIINRQAKLSIWFFEYRPVVKYVADKENRKLICQTFNVKVYLRYWNFYPMPPTLTQNVKEFAAQVIPTENGFFEWRAQVPYHVHNGKDKVQSYGVETTESNCMRAADRWLKNALNQLERV